MSDHTSNPAELAKEELQKRIDAFVDATSIDIAVVKEKLEEEGVSFDKPSQALTILDNEDYLPFADLAKHFLDTNLTKKALLRLGISHLRGRTNLTEPGEIGELANVMQDMVKANRPISQWRDSELLDAYDDASPQVWKELSERAHGRPCIVFKKNGNIDSDASFTMLQIAKRQTTSDKMRIGDELKKVYRPGKFLEKPLDASPFFPNIPLVGEYCSESDTNWEGIDRDRRVLVRIHVTEIEKNESISQLELKTINEDAKNLNNNEFMKKYGQARLLYDELEEQNQLPTLKLMRKNIKNQKVDSGF